MMIAEKQVVMRLFNANREDYGKLKMLFDTVECENQISMMLASQKPGDPVRGWAAFPLYDENEDGSPKFEWCEGIIEWWTITPPPTDYLS